LKKGKDTKIAYPNLLGKKGYVVVVIVGKIQKQLLLIF